MDTQEIYEKYIMIWQMPNLNSINIQLIFNKNFIATSFAQVFLQVVIKELILALTARDIETDNEIFRLFLKNL